MYRVAWTKRAFRAMDRIIQNQVEQRELLRATLRDIAAVLSGRPDQVGESRVDKHRIETFGPLTVYYQVFTADRVVRIMSVHLHQPLFGQ